MLARRPLLQSGSALDQIQSPAAALGGEIFGSRRIERRRHSEHGDDDPRKVEKERSTAVQASHISTGSWKSRASLAYVRSLSCAMKPGSLKAGTQHVSRSVSDTTVELTMHVIPYSDLVLKRRLDGGRSLVDGATESEYSWEDAWKLYMQSQTATLKELAARVEECNPQIIDRSDFNSGNDTPAISMDVVDDAWCSIVDNNSGAESDRIVDVEVERSSTAITGEVNQLRRGRDGHELGDQPSFLSRLRLKKLGVRKTSGLMLLNVLAALYGSSTVAGKFASEVSPGLPPSLSSLVRFSSALLVFLPALRNVFGRDKNPALLKAGAELGGLLFTAAVLETCGTGGASSDAPLLFAFTMIFVPIMELCAGRQSVRNITRMASLVALSGMGVLEEEGFGWKGVSVPQVGDVWGLAASAVYALHIFRSEAYSSRFEPYELTAIQCGTVAALSAVLELLRALDAGTTATEYVTQLQALPWGPLIYTGLVCSGLCSWLEIHGLRSVHASTATMVNTTIPIWGAFLSFLRGESLDDSAVVGGSVILVASLIAQMISNQDHVNTEDRPQRLVSNSPRKAPSSPNPASDHVQGALITSQLKFPYYAAQAKRLLVEAKFKLLSVKSLVVSTLLTNPQPVPPDSLHSAAAPTAIATSVTLQQVANAVTNAGVSPSSNAHAAVVSQWLDIASGVLESAITALGSDIVQGVEEAEDVANLLERGTQSALHHLAVAASVVNSLVVSLDSANLASLEMLKSVDTITTRALLDQSLACTIPLIAHHADAALQLALTCTSNP